MSSDLNPTLRALPYLLGITAVVFIGFPIGREVDIIVRILIGALTYVVTFWLSRVVIERLAGRSSSPGRGTDADHGAGDSSSTGTDRDTDPDRDDT